MPILAVKFNHMNVAKNVLNFLKNSPATRSALGAGAGVGLSALENKLIDDPGLEKVNLGLGAATGGMIGYGGRPGAGALSGLALKQMALLGTNAFMKDAPLRAEAARNNAEAAKANLATEQIKKDQAGKWSNQDKVLAALAAAGVGAAGIYGVNSILARRKKPKTTDNAVLKGDPGTPRRQKLKIEVPASSLPPEFFQSLVDADDRDRALTTLQTKTACIEVELDRSQILAGLVADVNDLFAKRAFAQDADPAGLRHSGFDPRYNTGAYGLGQRPMMPRAGGAGSPPTGLDPRLRIGIGLGMKRPAAPSGGFGGIAGVMQRQFGRPAPQPPPSLQLGGASGGMPTNGLRMQAPKSQPAAPSSTSGSPAAK